MIKLITDDGLELSIENLTSFIIQGKTKVLIVFANENNLVTEMSKIIFALDDFFGSGNWLLSTPQISASTVEIKEIDDGQFNFRY